MRKAPKERHFLLFFNKNLKIYKNLNISTNLKSPMTTFSHSIKKYKAVNRFSIGNKLFIEDNFRAIPHKPLTNNKKNGII